MTTTTNDIRIDRLTVVKDNRGDAASIRATVGSADDIHCHPASEAGRCVCCGRTVQAGQLQLRMAGRPAHVDCALTVRATTPSGIDGKRRTETLPATHGHCGHESRRHEHQTPRAQDDAGVQDWGVDDVDDHRFPHQLVYVEGHEPGVSDGDCSFEVRHAGWSSLVTAKSLSDAAWAAEAVAREHLPIQLEVRCANRSRCGHPPTWAPTWAVAK